MVSLWRRVTAQGSHVQSINWERFKFHAHFVLAMSMLLKNLFQLWHRGFKTRVVYVGLVKVLCYFVSFAYVTIIYRAVVPMKNRMVMWWMSAVYKCIKCYCTAGTDLVSWSIPSPLGQCKLGTTFKLSELNY